MQWEKALKKIERSEDRELQKQILDLLHQEVNQGEIDDPLFTIEIEKLYQKQTHPVILSLLKRLQNRVSTRKTIGKDLLRLTHPILSESQKKEIWANIQALKSVYDETVKGPDLDFESRYQVIEQIGDGGMSRVFKGIRRSDNQEVAIKYLKEEFFSSPGISERFNRECRLCLTFKHPSIVDVYEIDKGEKSGFLIMEYLPEDGVDKILGHPDLTLECCLDIIKQAAEALVYIHEKGIVHRDIKLSNLLIKTWHPGRQIKIKLADFGISKNSKLEGLTILGTKMGTEFYCAPEQRESPETVDARADIYSLGVCLYRLLSKKHYPEGDFPPIDQVCPGAPKQLNDMVMKCLKTDPNERYSTVKEFLEQLNQL